MARPLRIEYDGALYHITSRGNERRPVFKVDTDRNNFLNTPSKSVKNVEDWKWSSYCPTAGKSKSHPCLTTDWILGQFARKKETAERKYKEFIEAGIEDKGIWKDVKGQSILGSDVADHLKLYYTTISRIVNDK